MGAREGHRPLITASPLDFSPESIKAIFPKCGDCPDGGEVDIAQGPIIYPNRPDLWGYEDGSERWWYLCRKCWGYCGVHRSTLKPLGTPAGAETRKARTAAHAAFDLLWKKRMAISGIGQQAARGRGYKWLAAQLGIGLKHCHINEMDAALARRVVEICKGVRA
jgi:hypothetical protein